MGPAEPAPEACGGRARERGARGAGPAAEAARRSRAETPVRRRATPPPLRARRSVQSPTRRRGSCSRAGSGAAPPPAVPHSRAPWPAGAARGAAGERPKLRAESLGLAFGPRGPEPLHTGTGAGPRREPQRRGPTRTRATPSAGSLFAARKARAVVRAQGAGDLTELLRTAPPRAGPASSSPGEAGFGFLAGSIRTAIGGMGGRGAQSPKPQSVCGVTLGYFVSGRGRETLTLFTDKLDCSPKSWWPLISAFAVKVDFSNTIFV